MKSKEHNRNPLNQPNRCSDDGDLKIKKLKKKKKRKIRVCKIFENFGKKGINRERMNKINQEHEQISEEQEKSIWISELI